MLALYRAGRQGEALAPINGRGRCSPTTRVDLGRILTVEAAIVAQDTALKYLQHNNFRP